MSIRVRRIKERFKKLQNGPMRGLVAVVATIQQSIKFLSPILIYVDRDGDWHNCRLKIHLVSPELNVSSYKAIKAAVEDYWFFSYSPKAGDTIIDIGAGIGDDAVAFARAVGVNGRVIAIEAHPKTYRCLIKTIKANRLKNITALNIAVSDSEGNIKISEEENFLSNSTYSRTGKNSLVSANTLESILSQTGSLRADLVKMNIEGGETNALLGMKSVFNTTKNIVVSCHDFMADRGESLDYRTYADVNMILENAEFVIANRNDDLRKEVQYYLYGKKL